MLRLDRPLLVFDGDCAFCRAWIARWRQATAGRVDYAPSAQVAARFADIAPERFRDAVVLIERDGRAYFGAEAVFRSLAEAPGRGLGLALYERVPGFAAVSEALYRAIARHRPAAHALTRLLWGDHVAPPGERLTAWIFLRLLGVVYLTAFASLAVQIQGLVGRDGLLPIGALLDAAWVQIGARALWVLPTLSWMNHGDGFLVAQCWAGVVASLLLIAGVAPVAMLIVAWALYLSVSGAGQEFLWFQWDSLLLEAGFLAIFLAPLVLRSTPRRDPPVSRLALWSLRALLFRLMFGSAVVKWSSGDPEWHHLTALTFHYQTQPLPPWTAWYAHHLSAGFHAFSTVMMFAIEGVAPFFIFAPRRLRMLAAWLLIFLQTLIVITGNYGFFNLLAIALCVLLFDDPSWPLWRRAVADTGEPAPGTWPPVVTRPVLIALLVISVVPLARSFRQRMPALDPLEAVYRELSPLHLVNPYGLFAVMTTRRLEIVVEGSEDGVTWKAYEFRWKPGDTRRVPAFMAPHMPRLDWQMWFAALQPDNVPRWFATLCARLLQGSKPVLGLLAGNPFPSTPPRFVRARLYDYRFSSAAERRASGAWWVRTPAGEFAPPLTLEDGELRVVRLPETP